MASLLACARQAADLNYAGTLFCGVHQTVNLLIRRTTPTVTCTVKIISTGYSRRIAHHMLFCIMVKLSLFVLRPARH